MVGSAAGQFPVRLFCAPWVRVLAGTVGGPTGRHIEGLIKIRMNQKELKELIEFLIEKDIAEFELERGDVKVRIKRGGEQGMAHAHGEARFFAMPAASAMPAQRPVVVPAGSGGGQLGGLRQPEEETSHREVADRRNLLRGSFAGSSSIRQTRRHGGIGAGALHCRSHETAQRD